MVLSEIPSARAFQAIRSVSVTELSRLKEEEVRPLLPCLVRMALCSPVDESPKWTEARKEVQKLLSGLEVVNSIVALLSVDFSLLEQDALKEQQLRRKAGGNAGTSVLVENLQNGLALEFERSEPSRRLRLVLSELLRIMSQVSPKLLWLATLPCENSQHCGATNAQVISEEQDQKFHTDDLSLPRSSYYFNMIGCA